LGAFLAERLDQLPNLTTLHLENNQLKALPESIGFCPSLVKLKCSTNLLRSLPHTMGNLKKVQRLDFANNLIHSVPPVMGHLKALKEFTLRYNPLDNAYQHATDEGLSKFLAFLKKEEAREEAETRERLRPIGTQVHHRHHFHCRHAATWMHMQLCKEQLQPWHLQLTDCSSCAATPLHSLEPMCAVVVAWHTAILVASA
jgi:Leucine-rich repeat (LRR) protein